MRPELPFHHYRPRPGHPDWPRLFAEAREAAAAIAPTLEPPQAKADARRRRARAHATTLRNYVENRRRARAGREDLLPMYFIWTLLRDCNFRCEYCDDHQGHKYPDLPKAGTLDTAQGLELLRIMRTRTPSVYFAGGEPTMRRDLPTLTRAARDLDYYPILINTNGSAIDRHLRKPAWRTWLADTDVVIVSLDGLHLETLAKMWVYRRPEDVVRNLLLLRELAAPMGVKLMVNAVIQPGRVDLAADVLDLANDLGIGFCPVPVNVGPRVDATLQDDPAYRALVERILERKRGGYDITGSLRMNQRLLRSAPLDCRNTLKPHIDHDGALLWPCKASVNVSPERVRVLDFENVESLYAHASGLVNPTRFHGPAKNQCGASCNWAQNYTTDAYAHGLRHPMSLVREVVQFLGAA
jgi:MoaA/NifB/PqqE/SkfB family radical SAM enzyme